MIRLFTMIPLSSKVQMMEQPTPIFSLLMITIMKAGTIISGKPLHNQNTDSTDLLAPKLVVAKSMRSNSLVLRLLIQINLPNLAQFSSLLVEFIIQLSPTMLHMTEVLLQRLIQSVQDMALLLETLFLL